MAITYTFACRKTGETVQTTERKLAIAAEAERKRCKKAKETPPRWAMTPSEFEFVKEEDEEAAAEDGDEESSS